MYIYIVEIPHQFKPSCWSVRSKEKFIELIEKSTECTDGECWYNAGWEAVPIEFDEDGEVVEWFFPPKTFEQAVEVCGRDLSGLLVFMDENEARKALFDKTFERHQGVAARQALREALKMNSSER